MTILCRSFDEIGRSAGAVRILGLAVIGLLCFGMLPVYGQEDAAVLPVGEYPSLAYSGQKEIVIGFVGGRVRHDDERHPEVQLADTLRRLDGSTVDAEVFENRHREQAFHKIKHLLDANHDGVLTADEKRAARIIIYGHSWGGSETVTLARELEMEDIPVLLTVQVDSIRKPGEEDSAIPVNVAKAVNFYQTQGPLHGQKNIYAVDPAKTKIFGNIEMGYKDQPVNCGRYPWFARTFTKTHIEIENDPRVWDRVLALINAEMQSPTLTAAANGSSR